MVTRSESGTGNRPIEIARLSDEELIRHYEAIFGRLTPMTRERFLRAAQRHAAMSSQFAKLALAA